MHIAYNSDMFRIGTGIAVILVGLWLSVEGYAEGLLEMLPGSIVVAIGIAILLNKNEDKIEEVTN